MWPLYCTSNYGKGRDGGNAAHHDTYDLEDRETSATEIHGVYPPWANGLRNALHNRKA
jgi:hypothetical protein